MWLLLDHVYADIVCDVVLSSLLIWDVAIFESIVFIASEVWAS